jgi:hypothetical protein
VQGEAASEEGLLVAAALLDLEPVKAVGTAPGGDWARLTVAVRDGLRTARLHRADPAGLLAAVGADTVAQGAGLLAQAASRRTPVLLDGSVLVAAAGSAPPASHPARLPGGWPGRHRPRRPASRRSASCGCRCCSTSAWTARGRRPRAAGAGAGVRAGRPWLRACASP